MTRHRALFVAGAVPAAAAAMRGWLSAGHEIGALWLGDSPKRGVIRRDARLAWLAPQWSAAAVARRHAIPVREVPRLASWAGALDAARAVGADVLVSVYFPFLVPPALLAHFDGRAVNLHPAPLPRYRGPTPGYAMVLDRSILTDGAMTLHVMAEGFDNGDIIARRPIEFPQDRCMVRLSLATARAGRELVATALPAYLDGRIVAEPQDEAAASYARVSPAGIRLGSHFDLRTARLLCETIGRGRHLEVAGLDGVKVVGFGRTLGPATGTAPLVGLWSVETDVADARVRLARKRPWSGLVRRLRKLAIQIADRDAPLLLDGHMSGGNDAGA